MAETTAHHAEHAHDHPGPAKYIQLAVVLFVLTALEVPVSSQMLVFSKTSFQYLHISPEHPRALYFNDDVYVGSVLVELDGAKTDALRAAVSAVDAAGLEVRIAPAGARAEDRRREQPDAPVAAR